MTLNLVYISSLLILLALKSKLILNLGKEPPSNDERKIHTVSINRLGGLIFLSLIFLTISIEDSFEKSLIIFAFLISIVGFLEDIMKKISPYIRFSFILILVTYFVFTNNFVVQEFDNYFLQILINTFNIVAIVFSIVSLMFLVNGFNFIDGLNGLLLGFSLIILGIYCIYCYETSDSLYLICSNIFIVCTIFHRKTVHVTLCCVISFINVDSVSFYLI